MDTDVAFQLALALSVSSSLATHWKGRHGRHGASNPATIWNLNPMRGFERMPELTENDRILYERRRFFAFGTAKIQQHLASRLATCQRVINFISFAIPLVVGGLYISGIAASKSWITSLSVVLVVQSAVSLWALVSNWQSRHDILVQAYVNNNLLSSRYDDMLRLGTKDEKLDWAYMQQESDDSKTNFTNSDHRYGMRLALIRFQTPCATCKVIPTTTSISRCSTCGK